MVAYLLHYRDANGKRELFMNKFAAMFGMRGSTIDPSKIKGNRRYATIDEALADLLYKDCSWVWLDHRGTIMLDEFEHPIDNVVYCIGSDLNGFDGKDPSDLSGVKIRLRQPLGKEMEWFATMVAPLVVYDRFLYLRGRRA